MPADAGSCRTTLRVVQAAGRNSTHILNLRSTIINQRPTIIQRKDTEVPGRKELMMGTRSNLFFPRRMPGSVAGGWTARSEGSHRE